MRSEPFLNWIYIQSSLAFTYLFSRETEENSNKSKNDMSTQEAVLYQVRLLIHAAQYWLPWLSNGCLECQTEFFPSPTESCEGQGEMGKNPPVFRDAGGTVV